MDPDPNTHKTHHNNSDGTSSDEFASLGNSDFAEEVEQRTRAEEQKAAQAMAIDRPKPAKVLVQKGYEASILSRRREVKRFYLAASQNLMMLMTGKCCAESGMRRPGSSQLH